MMGIEIGQTGRARRGASLVEVMVVLVVLLIGVFAVIRVFPVGFTFLRTGSNRTLAGRLAQGVLEQIKSDAANLPDSVTYSYFGPSGPLTVVNEDPDDLSVRGDGNPYFSDVNKNRYVRGEAVKIGLPSPGDFGSGFPYMVKFGPIYMDPAFGDPTTAPAGGSFYLNVYSAPLIPGDNQVDSENGTLNPFRLRGALRSVRYYALDPGTGGGGAFLLFAPEDDARTFHVRYLVQDENDSAGPARAEEEDVVVPANSFAWVPLTRVSTSESIAPGSEVVTRAFERIPSGQTWSDDDPYQYKLVSPNIASAPGRTSVANLGQIAFNPAGASFTEDTAQSGNRSFVAYIDYSVLDWHILRDDREVPSVFSDSAGAVPVRLTLTHLKRNGDANPDNTLYDGLFPSGDTDPAANYDLRVIRLDTGQVLVQGDYDLRQGADAGADYWVRDGRDGTWDSGTLYLNTNRVPRGTPVRALYKADGEWAVALQKASSLYRAWQTSQAGRPPFDSNNGNVQFGDPTRFGIEGTRIYFTGSELNKSVTVRIEAVDTSGRRNRLAPLQVTVDTPDGDHAYVDMARYLPANLQRWRVVDGVIQGVSVKVRVIWKDRTDDRSPWSIQDLDSYITQGAVQ